MIFQSALLEAGIANAEKFVGCFSLLLCFREDEHYYYFFFLLFVLQLHNYGSGTEAASARVRGEVALD